MQNTLDAKNSLKKSWPFIKEECLSILGSELHYQAMIYHLLRTAGSVPVKQLGMNVKMWIDEPVSDLFRTLGQKKHKDYQGGFEPIPDIVIFKPAINADWRRRNYQKTVLNMLMVIEVKASEREKSRLQPSEILFDIRKLAAHREEVISMGSDVVPVMLVIDSAPQERERMTPDAVLRSKELSESLGVEFMYASSEYEICEI